MSNKPDFKESVEVNFPHLSNIDQFRIVNYLEQAWRSGYRYAVVNDWWQTQEKDGDPK